MTETALLVVAKAPVPGLAKTRLSPPATPTEAAEIAAASLLDTLDAVSRTPRTLPIIALTGKLDNAVHTDELVEALRGWHVLRQRGVALGDRLAYAHQDAAACGLPIVQIGMDTPQINSELLADACQRLASVDAVLGLAEDGGWWAVGFRDTRFAELLRDVPTSRDDTGERTLRRLRAAGLDVATLPILSDVDEMGDATRLAAKLPGSRFATAVGSHAP